eukprot:Amastigsp_a511647_15.p3 type:complete len:126 gc:universal Amastigsp_a511647_15:391-14(-)
MRFDLRRCRQSRSLRCTRASLSSSTRAATMSGPRPAASSFSSSTKLSRPFRKSSSTNRSPTRSFPYPPSRLRCGPSRSRPRRSSMTFRSCVSRAAPQAEFASMRLDSGGGLGIKPETFASAAPGF